MKTAVFWNVCFYRPLRSQRNHLIICTIIVNMACVPIQYVQWHFSCSIKREKTGQKLFFTGKIAFVFKTLCFQQPFMSKKHALISSRVNVKKICGPVKTVTWCFSHSIIRGRIGQRHLSPWKKLFFEKFVSIDLLGAKEMFLSFEQSWSKHLLGPFRLFHELSMFDITKKMAKIFSSLERLPCFEKVVFSTAS